MRVRVEGIGGDREVLLPKLTVTEWEFKPCTLGVEYTTRDSGLGELQNCRVLVGLFGGKS